MEKSKSMENSTDKAASSAKMDKNGASEKPDLMELYPIRLFEWETDEETQNIIVLRPKFTSKLAKKIILPFYGQKFFKIKFDALGSMVWKLADGEHTVGQILKAMEEKFTDEEDLANRLSKFIYQLVREKFIQLLQRVEDANEVNN